MGVFQKTLRRYQTHWNGGKSDNAVITENFEDSRYYLTV